MTVKYRLMSDIHLEFGALDVPVIEDEDKMVLILAGDVGVASRPETYVDFIRDMSKRHDTVIWIMGNHEYYTNYIEETLEEIKENLEPMPNNVHVMENGVVVVHDVAFICATLWSDFNGNDPMSKLSAANAMNDHHIIYKYSPSGFYSSYRNYKPKFSPDDAYDIHQKHRTYIFDQLKGTVVRKKVVVTHHAPSYLSIADAFKDEREMNGAFVSDMFEKIFDSDADYWVHGHTHNSFDYMIGDCRIIANPRGYARKNYSGELKNENSQFNSNLVIEV